MDQQNFAKTRIFPLLDEIEGKLLQIRETIQDLMMSLELQEHVQWAEMVQKFCSLSGMFASLQQLMRKPAHDNLEDNVKLMKMTQFVPKNVQLNPDQTLTHLTEGRLSNFGHNIVPILLRTKLKPEVEEDELNIERDRSKGDIPKQVKTLNSHIDMLCGKLADCTKQYVTDKREAPSYSQEETVKLVKAICLGKDIYPKHHSLHPGPTDASRSAASSQKAK